MRDSFERTPLGDAQPDWSAEAVWADVSGYSFKRTHEHDGFVVEGDFDKRPWRLEWGPPQRSYIEGRELRMRMELHLPPDLNMLIMSRPLIERLEHKLFDSFTENLQTQIDVSLPEEMRWLAMLPKVALPLPAPMPERFGGVAMAPAMLASWIEGVLAERLTAAGTTMLAADPPFILMTLRGRLYLRMQLATTAANVLAQTVGLFEAAAFKAVVVGSKEPLKPNRESGPVPWQELIRSNGAR